MLIKSRGFTIVELLIVIVVIALLAVISIVAYNGVQERARYSSMKSDIQAINKALLMYHGEHGKFPGSGSTVYYIGGAYSPPPIPDIEPKYISKIPGPVNDGQGSYYAYIVTNDGSGYKIIRLVPDDRTLPQVEQGDSTKDPRRNTRAWGFWNYEGRNL